MNNKVPMLLKYPPLQSQIAAPTGRYEELLQEDKIIDALQSLVTRPQQCHIYSSILLEFTKEHITITIIIS